MSTLLKNNISRRFLVVAAAPPPLTGQSIATQGLLESFEENELEYELFDLSQSFVSRGFKKYYLGLLFVLRYLYVVRRNEFVYLQLSQSVFGSLRDLSVIVLGKVFKKRIVCHLHGGGGVFQGVSAFHKAFRYLSVPVYKLVDQFIFLDNYEYKKHWSYIKSEYVAIVENFAQIGAVNRVKDEKFTFLYLSNLHPDKGCLEAVKAFKLLFGDDPQYQFLIAGGVPDNGFFNDLSPLLSDNVQYLGVVKGLAKDDLLSRSDVLVLPTRYACEGQPISIIEAYFAGLVVITSYHNGIPHIFKDKVNGFRAEGRDVKSISLAMQKCMSVELVNEISQYNIIYAKENFTKIIHIKKMFSVLFPVGL